MNDYIRMGCYSETSKIDFCQLLDLSGVDAGKRGLIGYMFLEQQQIGQQVSVPEKTDESDAAARPVQGLFVPHGVNLQQVLNSAHCRHHGRFPMLCYVH